jgi:hypothetical protein
MVTIRPCGPLALLFFAYAPLAGSAPLPVEIEKLNAAAASCGITESRLDDVTRRALEASQRQPNDGPAGQLNVAVSVNQIRGAVCKAQVAVRMKAYTTASLSSTNPRRGQHALAPVIVLCDKSGSYSAPKGSFSVKVETAVDYSVRQCLSSFAATRPGGE